MPRHEDNRTKNFTFNEAIEYLMAAKVIEGSLSVGSNQQMTSIELPAGGIDKRANGYFHRSDLNKLIGWVRLGG